MNHALKQFILPVFKQKPTPVFYFFVLFITAFLYLGALQVFPTMLDPDGFFHAKMALLTADQGFVSSFTYLPETILAEYWTDQHWAYHVFLIPFVTLFNPLWGVKIAATVLGITYILIFFAVLRLILKNDRAAFWWTMILFLSGPFVFRLILVKAQPIAFMLIILGIFFFKNKRLGWLFLTQLLYVLTHGSFFLLPVLIFWSIVYTIFFDKKYFSSNYKSILNSVLVVVLAISIGIVIQPTFPENIIFYWHQIFSIGFTQIPDYVVVGKEWQTATAASLIRNLHILFFVGLITVPFLYRYRRQLSNEAYWWAWLLIPLTFLSLGSIRHIEFLIPFVVVFYAVTWKSIPRISFYNFYTKQRRSSKIFGGAMLLMLALWAIYPVVSIFKLQKLSTPLSAFKQEGEIINSADGSTMVLNTRWDAFPMLFYYTEDVRFLTGLDSVFLFLEDPEKYQSLLHVRNTGEVDNLLSSLDNMYKQIYLLEVVSDDKLGSYLYKDIEAVRVLNGEAPLYRIDNY